MAVVDADILVKLSINTGPGNSTAQGNVNDSIGGFMSSTQLTDNTLHNLFDAVTGDENAALDDEYRCVFIHNSNATSTLGPNTKLWISVDTAAGAADIALALDGTGVVAYNSASAQAERITNEDTIPTGETFTTPLSKGAGIAVPNLAANQVHAVWVRRTAAAGGARSSVNATIRVEGDVL